MTSAKSYGVEFTQKKDQNQQNLCFKTTTGGKGTDMDTLMGGCLNIGGTPCPPATR